ncbi:MAG: hypothetical protein R6U64_06575 [Bacteroidales bacterium]
MKRKLTMMMVMATFLMIGVSPTNARAQIGTEVDYNNVSYIGGGLMLGYYSYGYAGARSLSFPPLTAFYEKGIHERITVGPFLSYAQWSYDYAGFGSNWGYTWSFLQVGGRGSYHLTSLLNEWFDSEIDESKWDIYATLLVGFEFRSFSYDNDFDDGLDYDNDWRLFVGPLAGTRYFLNERFALFVEAGRGSLGALTFGVTYDM